VKLALNNRIYWNCIEFYWLISLFDFFLKNSFFFLNLFFCFYLKLLLWCYFFSIFPPFTENVFLSSLNSLPLFYSINFLEERTNHVLINSLCGFSLQWLAWEVWKSILLHLVITNLASTISTIVILRSKLEALQKLGIVWSGFLGKLALL
jgi:hypothetical protein